MMILCWVPSGSVSSTIIVLTMHHLRQERLDKYAISRAKKRGGGSAEGNAKRSLVIRRAISWGAKSADY
jgi:hypothetical protein